MHPEQLATSGHIRRGLLTSLHLMMQKVTLTSQSCLFYHEPRQYHSHQTRLFQ